MEDQVLEHLAAQEPVRPLTVRTGDDVLAYLLRIEEESPTAEEILRALSSHLTPSRRRSIISIAPHLGIEGTAMREFLRVFCLASE